jgi:DSF synthase
MNTEDFGLSNHFNQLFIRYDESHEALWTYFNQRNMIPCANGEIVRELNLHQKEVSDTGGVLYAGDQVHSVKYAVSASLTPNVYNLGGQLSLIRELALNRQKEALLSYAIKAIDLIHTRLTPLSDD